MNAQEVRAALLDGTITVTRSKRRRKTISATRRMSGYRLAVPAFYDPERNAADIARLIRRLAARTQAAPSGDTELEELARRLSEQHFDDGILPSSVRWSSRQRKRFASATSATRQIRVSDRLRNVPIWVLEVVLVHELAHLREPNHSPAFYALAHRHPRWEHADIFLEGFSHGEAAAACARCR